MKNLLFLLLGGALLVCPGFAQTQDDISVPEFRQAMYDFATVVDSIKGTTFAGQLTNVPDSTFAKWYSRVPNGRQFKESVNFIVARRAGRGALPPRTGQSNAAMSRVPRAREGSAPEPQFAMSSSPFAAGISSVVPPDPTLFPPGYPETSQSNWLSMAQALRTFGGLSGSDASLTTQRCDPDAHAALSQLVSAFHGIKDGADAICDIVPDVLVVILGEGTTVPAKEICFAVTLVITVFNSAAEGLLSDCEEQSGFVNGAEIEATWHNTIALYNQKLRLKIEQNLGNTAAPMGLFELPSSLGGYLEVSRSIVADVITKLTAAGQNVSTASAALLQGDTLFNTKNYKGAYKQYQKAYLLAVQ